MDSKIKKRLLRFIPSGIYLVGLKTDKSPHFFMVSWVSQASLQKPAIVMGVRKKSNAYSFLQENTQISLNYFSKEDLSFLKDFMKIDGDAIAPWIDHTKDGTPKLKNAIAFLEILNFTLYPTDGDHALIWGELHDVGLKNGLTVNSVDPLVLSDTPWSYGG